MTTARFDDSPADVKQRLDAERRRVPFVHYRRGDGGLVILELDAAAARLLIGRDETTDVSLPWDAKVSGAHAWLERTGRFWSLHDDGMSRNGSYVNGER